MKAILERLQQCNIHKIQPNAVTDTGDEYFRLHQFQITVASINLEIIRKNQPQINIDLLYSKKSQPNDVFLETLKPYIPPLANFYNIFYNLLYELKHFYEIFLNPPEFLSHWSKDHSVATIIRNIVLPIIQNQELINFAKTSEKIFQQYVCINVEIKFAIIHKSCGELNKLLASKNIVKDGHSAPNKLAISELRDETFRALDEHNKFIDNLELSFDKYAKTYFQEIKNAWIYSDPNKSLVYLEFCINLLENDSQFNDALYTTDKHIIDLERAILSPYYNFNGANEIETLDKYRQRLNNYQEDLEKYKNMLSRGVENRDIKYSAFEKAMIFKTYINDLKSDPIYHLLLSRLNIFENLQSKYLNKIKRLNAAIDNILHSNEITLAKIYEMQANETSEKRILVTVANCSNEIKYQKWGHNTSGHMLAILFDGNKPPVCISLRPISDENSAKKYKMSGIRGFILKLLGLPYHTRPATNGELRQELIMYHKAEISTPNLKILPPIIFHCNDNLGIDFTKALAQTTNDLQDDLIHNMENNCAVPVRRMIEAGISERNLKLDSSTLAGMTVPHTLYKKCQLLHDTIQQKRDIVAKTLFEQEQKQFESASLPTKINELRSNFENAKNALRTIKSSIEQLENKLNRFACGVIEEINHALALLERCLPSEPDNHFWATFDPVYLYSKIKDGITLQEKYNIQFLYSVNLDNKYLIPNDRFVNTSTKELLNLFMINNFKIPLYFEAPLLTLTELLKTLPAPYTTHLEQICDQITKELPAQPALDLDLPLQIHSRSLEALIPAYRHDNHPNLLHNTMQLRNIILDIQFKQAKLTETKVRLDPNHESAKPLLKQLEHAISYCQKSAESLQSAYGKLNQYLYFENLDVVARKDQPNPFNALKKIFPSINPYYHLQDIFQETANIFYCKAIPKPPFWQFWNKYEYKKYLTMQSIKSIFDNDRCTAKNYQAIKLKINKLRPTLWDQYWLSDTTLAQRYKCYHELADKTHLFYLLKLFTNGECSDSDLLLQLKTLAKKSMSIYKNNIIELLQNLSETQQFNKEQLDINKIKQQEQPDLNVLTSTAAILSRCNYPDQSKQPSEDISAADIKQNLPPDEKLNDNPSLCQQNDVIPQEDLFKTAQLPNDLDERLYAMRSV